jgi:hydroxypyruvate reductase
LSEIQLRHLRFSAADIFNTALRSVDAHELTRRAIVIGQGQIRVGNVELDAKKPIYVIAIGKAAASMSRALNETFQNRIRAAILSCHDTGIKLPPTWQRFRGGHPLPNGDSIEAAKGALRLIANANSEKATIICAVSGGGSAMFESPVDASISLKDLREANRLLISCGATIDEVNTVRRSFSAVKGGKLSAQAPNSQFITLIISDTNPGDEANVASGPTVPLRKTETAEAIVRKYQLEARLPETILNAVRRSQNAVNPGTVNASHFVLANNDTALRAAAARAKELGFRSVIAEDISEQPIEEGCELLLRRLAFESPPVCVISGGEFSCSVRGNGKGGRNSETVLRASIAIDGLTDHIVVLSAGSDGIDGNSSAAGAIGDENTITRARVLGLDASEVLSQSDSFRFFDRLKDAIVTGPTGTNVRDLRITLRTPSIVS